MPVVLNACQSGMVDAAAETAFASVAASLLRAGTRGVVAMAYSLFVSGAQEFLPDFYCRLFETGNVAEAVRAGRNNLRYHLAYVGHLTETRSWLAGDAMSFADLAASAHLSTLDYLGEVPWEEFGAAKNWYALIKSRPSFRPLLKDRVAGFTPSETYADLDF